MISKQFAGRRCPVLKKRLLVFLFFLLLPLTPFAALGESLVIDADKQLEYADHLVSEGAYDRAADEYERFVFFFPEDPRVAETMLKRGRAYFEGKQYQKAIDILDGLISRNSLSLTTSTDTGAAAYFLISECYVKLNMPGQAVNTLNNLYLLAETPELKDDALYRIGWIYTESGRWQPALAAFHRIRPVQQEAYRVDAISEGLAAVDTIPQKSPMTAGVLGVLPGAGYVYCERYQDALVAFILNGGLMVGAWKAFDSDNPALGGLLCLVGTGFYTGSIYGSVNSARKYNQRQTRRFIDRLKEETRISLMPLPHEKGVALAIQFEF